MGSNVGAYRQIACAAIICVRLEVDVTRSANRNCGIHIDIVIGFQPNTIVRPHGQGTRNRNVIGRLKKCFRIAGNVGNLHNGIGWAIAKSQIRCAIRVIGRAGLSTGVQCDIGWIKQKLATDTMAGGQIYLTDEIQIPLAGNLDKTTITALDAATRCNIAVVARGVIRPDNRRTSITVVDSIRIDAGIFVHISSARIVNLRILALVIPPHQHRTTTRIT